MKRKEASIKEIASLCCLACLLLACEREVAEELDNGTSEVTSSRPTSTPTPTPIPTSFPTSTPPTSSPGVVFATDFEDVKNWVIPRPPKGTSGYSWEMTHGTPGMPPPQRLDGSQLYDLYRVGATLFEPANATNAYEIGAGHGRGGSRGLLYNVEVSGTVGAWTGGSPIEVFLGTAGHPDLYVRFYARYPDSWKWTNADQTPNTAALQKIMKIARFNGTPGDGKMGGPYAAPAYGGEIAPVWIPDWYQYISVTPSYTIINNSERYAPDYTANDPVQDFYTTNPSLYPVAPPLLASPAGHRARGPLFPTDGQWHSYEFRAKMNSSPGAPDGLSEIWIDGTKVWSKTNIAWVKAGGTLERGWNLVAILDNASLASFPLSDQVTQPMYIDDVVIATSYIGPAP